jgi:Leucine-rich repeat (LRR) protein
LSHNNLERLENMDRLISLKVLDISRNKIADVDYLLVLGPTKLAELEASYNRMPVSYLDQLLVIVTELKNLRKVTFAGNELALNKFYRVKLSSVAHLTHLDSLVIKDYARRGLKVTVCSQRNSNRQTR